MVKRPIQLADGGSNPTPSLQFVAISKSTATNLVVEHHYLHRRCPISWSCGVVGESLAFMYRSSCCGADVKKRVILDNQNEWEWECQTCLLSASVRTNLDARSRDVYELNRLWLSDDLPKYTESRFIGWALRELKKINPRMILISYADGARGHIGVVYKATNWLYTGTSTPFVDLTFPGYADYRSVPMEKRGKKIGNKREWANDPNAIRKTRSIKHRYVWTADPKDASLIKWPKQAYPLSAAAQQQEVE
jgi:hypothetical protein